MTVVILKAVETTTTKTKFFVASYGINDLVLHIGFSVTTVTALTWIPLLVFRLVYLVAWQLKCLVNSFIDN